MRRRRSGSRGGSSARRHGWTVVQLIPTLGPGGAERSTMEVARALVAAQHRSVVISGGGRWVTRLKAEGSEHIKLAIGSKSLALLATLFRLRSQLRRIEPDVVHVRSRLPAWLLRFALVGLKPRPAVVSTVHGLNSVSAYSRIMTHAERVIAVSRTAAEFLLQHYPGLDPARLRVISRGADPAEFPPQHRATESWRRAFFDELPALAGGRLLTLPGRGTRLKGHADAIELLARVRQAGVDARLLLLGVAEGKRAGYLDELRQVAREHGVFPYVALTATRGDVRDVYAASDLVLQLSTRQESFGRVVAEALLVGRPVLGYDHGGVGELLRQLYPAGLVPVRDLDAATARTLALLRAAPPVPVERVPQVKDLQRLTLSVYSELVVGTPPDPAFAQGV
ncbi:MAG: glycosyltransferase [Xanthomonadales bacterium]|nr:D-inositol-3-phosphate glycosyltransferase [Xanthomonadales bacterium]MCC6591989.1 glycosyltransferase [Xanthomonadales bacterium]MCE7930241.1 glycosyltransferase [Xanthomonadales bacterium PRO6]